MRNVIALRRSLALASMAVGLISPMAFGQAYGLDSRAPIGPYLNNVMPPASGAFAFPPVLSATGAFSNLSTLAPSTGLIPFTVNSPLWSDAAIKTRWIAVPNDGPPYASNEQISFLPIGEWTFPDGTVFVKHFELTVNEITGERKRLETRLLVRNETGSVYGVTYKWRSDNSDADLLPGALDEDIAITTASGPRIQRWSYPSRGQCITCHNANANHVLGVKTHQMNGDFTYPSTGRTDNQLRTFAHVGLLNPAPNEADIPNFLKSVAVNNSTVPVQYRMRSWIDANCSHCHRPGGIGPVYDGRLYTPYENQDIITVLRFRDVEGSPLYERDNALDDRKMPPLAKNMVDQTAMAVLRQWILSPLEVLSVYLYQDTSHLEVRFNSRVDPATATVVANYPSFDPNLVVTGAAMGSAPDTVILTLAAPLVANQTYYLAPQQIQDTAPSANTLWLQRETQFVAQYQPPVTGPRLANIATRLQVGTGEDVLISGFIVRGGPLKRVMIRAIGPSLAAFGVPNALADPVLSLHDQTGAVIATGDDWGTNANQQEIIDTGIAPASPKESVILMRLPSDNNGIAYTVVLRGAGDTTGVGLLEVYDLDAGLGPEAVNISTRGRVGVGDNVMIGGVIVAGQGAQRVIVRALGPSIPVNGKLADPMLELRDGNGGLIDSNDNWRSHHQDEIIATGIAPTNDLESAIIGNLPPANYTAVVQGVNNTTGVGLVEVYALN